MHSANDGTKTFMYFINDGIFGSFNCIASYNYVYIPFPLNYPSKNNPNLKEYSTIIWGQTCASRDKIYEIIWPELNIGDWLYFDNMGGYTSSLASTFNGFRIPEKYHYVTESYRYEFLYNIMLLCVYMCVHVHNNVRVFDSWVSR